MSALTFCLFVRGQCHAGDDTTRMKGAEITLNIRHPPRLIPYLGVPVRERFLDLCAHAHWTNSVQKVNFVLSWLATGHHRLERGAMPRPRLRRSIVPGRKFCTSTSV